VAGAVVAGANVLVAGSALLRPEGFEHAVSDPAHLRQAARLTSPGAAEGHPRVRPAPTPRDLLAAVDDLVDDAVVLGLRRGEPPVALGIGLDLLDLLTGVRRDELGHELLGVGHLLGLDRDVGRLAADATGRLVHHDPRVRQGVALARGAGAEEELAHRRSCRRNGPRRR
jgi:hypothetical protein